MKEMFGLSYTPNFTYELETPKVWMYYKGEQ